MHVAQPTRRADRTFVARAAMFLVIAVVVLAATAALVMSVLAAPRPIAPDAGGSSAGSSRPVQVQPHVEGKTGP